jgi:hypothetical protein
VSHEGTPLLAGDKFICPSCGNYDDVAFAATRTHKFQGAMVTHMVCFRCAEESPCSGSFNGVHGEIETVDDLLETAFDAAHLERSIPDELWGCAGHWLGRCVLCGGWAFWDRKEQRWRDPVVDP